MSAAYWARRRRWRKAHRYARHGETVIVRDMNGDVEYTATWEYYLKPRRLVVRYENGDCETYGIHWNYYRTPKRFAR